MKKLFTLVLAVLMLISCLPLSALAEDTTDPTGTLPAGDAVTYTVKFEPPTKKTYLVGQQLDLSGIALSVSGSDGSNLKIAAENMRLSGFDSTQTGSQTVTVTYYDSLQQIDNTVTFPVTVVDQSTLHSIAITTPPSKRSYIQGEPLDVSGGMLELRYDTHTDTVPMNNSMVSGFDSQTVGSQKLTVTYQGVTTTLSITVKAPAVTNTAWGSNLFWNVDTTGILTISGSGPMAHYRDVQDPSNPYVDGYPWHTQKDAITTVQVNSGVTTLAEQAFSGLKNLKSVQLPAGLTTVGNAALAFCANLTRVTFPAGVASIGKDVFWDSAVNTITFQGSAPTFDSAAFTGVTATAYYPGDDASWTSDVRQNYGGTITWVDSNAPTLTGISISVMPTKLTYVQNQDDLDVTGGKLLLTSSDGSSKTIDMTADMVSGFDKNMVGTQKLIVTYMGLQTSYTVSVQAPLVVQNIFVSEDPVRQMKAYYMVGESLDLSGGVLVVRYTNRYTEEIPLTDPAITVTGFDSSKSARILLTFTYQGEECVKPIYISQTSGKCGDNLTFVFDADTGTMTIQGTGAMYDYNWESTVTPWLGYADQIKKVVLPSGLTALGKHAFDCCSSLTDINLPEGIPALPDWVFNLCRSLKDLTIPASVKTIGEYAFSDCIALETLVIPEGVTSIGDYCFAGAASLKNLTVPKSLQVIGNVAFMTCPNLESLVFPEDSQLQSIRSMAFADSGLKEFTVPASVTEIAYQAFSSTPLEKITFKGSAPSIFQSPYSQYNDIFSSWMGSKFISAYYPGGDESWTDLIREKYAASSGDPVTITWTPSFGVVDNDSGFNPEVDGLDNILEEIIDDYNSGENPSVQMAISNVKREEITPEVLNAIEAAAQEKDIELMDLSLNLVVDGVKTNLGSQNNHVIIITLDYDATGKRNMVVYRYHNGKVDTLTQSPNSDGEFIEVKNGKLIIHAKKFSPYAVAYDPVPVVRFQTGTTAEITPQEVESGGKATRPADPVREHYYFLGWYTDEECTDQWDFETDTVTADVTLYAGWEKLKVVTFNTDGGSELTPAEVRSGSKVTAPADPTKDHQAFRGWFTDEECTDEWDFANDTVTEDITLYAKWEAGFEVVFNSIQGTAVATQVIVSGNKVVKPTDPTRTNYIFRGWYTDADYTTAWNFTTGTVTEDMTLYAKWEPNFLTDVAVTPKTVDVLQGEKQTFLAQVTAGQGSTVTVTWSLSGAKDSGTRISTSGVLTVDENEPAGTLTVTVTATCVTERHREVETDTATVTVIPAYEIVSGSGKRWSKNSTTNLVFVADGPYDLLEDILIDGKSVDLDYAQEDTKGTKVTLKPDYLKTLTNKSHTIELVYSDGGVAEGTFTVQKAASNARTGDTFRMGLYIGLMAVSAIAIVALIVLRRKRK